MDNNKKVSKQDSTKVAEAMYKMEFEQDDEKRESINRGLSVTHEQDSDVWTEGTIDAVIEDYEGEDKPIPRKGYEE